MGMTRVSMQLLRQLFSIQIQSWRLDRAAVPCVRKGTAPSELHRLRGHCSVAFGNRDLGETPSQAVARE